MHTKAVVIEGSRRRRRQYSPQFKADVVAGCRRPGVSIAAVALANGLNANLLRRWVVEHESRLVVGEDSAPPPLASTARVREDQRTFVPVQFQPQAPASADIRIEQRHGTTSVNLCWPVAASAECAVWLRELLK